MKKVAQPRACPKAFQQAREVSEPVGGMLLPIGVDLDGYPDGRAGPTPQYRPQNETVSWKVLISIKGQQQTYVFFAVFGLLVGKLVPSLIVWGCAC